MDNRPTGAARITPQAGKPRPPTWAAGIARCENPDGIPAGVVSIEKVK